MDYAPEIKDIIFLQILLTMMKFFNVKVPNAVEMFILELRPYIEMGNSQISLEC